VIENSVLSIGNSVLGHEQVHLTPINNNFIERKTAKYEAMIFNQNDHLTVMALVIKVT
jgi:hypothetical protein